MEQTGQRILVKDTETGGLDSKKHSLLQASFMVCEDGKVLDTLKINIVHETYCVTPKAMEINKIDLATHKGLPPEQAVKEIVAFVKKYFDKPAQVLGHNVSFDIGFVKELFAQQGVNYDDIFSYRVIDTSSFARILVHFGYLKDGGSLGNVARQLGVEFDSTTLHDSLIDCEVTYQVLLAMSRYLRTPFVSDTPL